MIRWFAAVLLIVMAATPAQAAGFKWSDILGGSSADAYSFQWVDREGVSHALEEYRGKALILHFWASWCRPCTEEMPSMTEWVRANPRVIFIPVSLDRSAGDAVRFLDSRGIDLPVLLTDESQARGVGASSLPTTMVIAGDGSVIQHHRGSRDWTSGAFTGQLLKGLGLATPSGRTGIERYDGREEAL